MAVSASLIGTLGGGEFAPVDYEMETFEAVGPFSGISILVAWSEVAGNVSPVYIVNDPDYTAVTEYHNGAAMLFDGDWWIVNMGDKTTVRVIHITG